MLRAAAKGVLDLRDSICVHPELTDGLLRSAQFQGYLVAAPMDIEARQRFMANIRKATTA